MERVSGEEQIKAALAAARHLEAARRQRQYQARPTRLRLPADRRQLQQRLARAVAGAGIDADAWEAQLERSRANADRRLQEAKEDAVRHSGERARKLGADVDGRRQVLDLLAGPGRTDYVALDHPFLILPTARIAVPDSSIAPWSSRARATFEHPGMGPGDDLGVAGTEELSFYYLWENAADGYAVVTIDGFLTLNGFCAARSSGAFLGGSSSTLGLHAVLEVFEWWNQPATTPLPQDGQRLPVVWFTADSTGWFDDDDTEYALVFRGFDLRYEQLAVPPHGVLVAEVLLSIYYNLGFGSVSADFASGEFNVGSPFVQLAVLR